MPVGTTYLSKGYEEGIKCSIEATYHLRPVLQKTGSSYGASSNHSYLWSSLQTGCPEGANTKTIFISFMGRIGEMLKTS